MWIKANYDCGSKGIRNAVKFDDFGPSMQRWGKLILFLAVNL